MICGIHAGEVEGKEGGLMQVRDLLDGRHGDVLSRMTLLVVPLFNADGNDRISPENRKLDIAHFSGQLGPDSGVGTRVNAAGVNLNRDYMRQDAPEMRQLQTRVCHPWNPHLVIDCHATNGSIHRFAMTYDIPHTVESGRREPIDYMREHLLPAVTAAVKKNDGLDSFYYGNFLRDEGGQGMGWITYTHHPRFGGNYRGLTNRLDLLLETYSYLPYAERVRTTYAFLRESLAYVAAHGREIVELLAGCELPPEEISVRYRLEAFPDTTVEVLTREPYTLDGAPVAVEVPYIGRFVGEHRVQRPLAYAVPRRHRDATGRPWPARSSASPQRRCSMPKSPPSPAKCRPRDARSSKPMRRRTWKPITGASGAPCPRAGRWCRPNSSVARSRCTCARRGATTAWSPANGSTSRRWARNSPRGACMRWNRFDGRE